MLTSRAWAQTWAALRLLAAAAGVAAIIGQLVRTLSRSAENGWPLGPTAIDFFSFFTILSNVGAAIALTIGAILIWRGTRVDPAWFASLLAWRALWTVIAFPIVWVVYTLVRGPLITDFRTGNPWWYPYPFLNPNIQPWGYGGVALYVIGIAAGILVLAAGVIWVGRRRGSDPAEASGLLSSAEAPDPAQ